MADTDKNRLSEYEDLFRDYMSCWNDALTEMEYDLQMHLGAHYTARQLRMAHEAGRELYAFNKTARQVDLVHGYEIRNRHILKIGPVGKEDDMAASQHTNIIMQQMAQGRGYEASSECFKWGSLVSGSNLLELYIDREGNRQFGRLAHNSFLLDPALTQTDLTDCRNILTGKWLHEAAIKRLLPTEADKIDKITPLSGGRWLSQPMFARADYMRLYENRWELKTGFRDWVINARTGQEVEFEVFKERAAGGSVKAANDIIGELREVSGQPIFIKYKKPYQEIGLDIFVDSELVWTGPSPLGIDEYPFIWFPGEWCPEMDRPELKIRSLTRKLRDPQHARDKRMNQALDIIESSINAGRLVRESSLVNPKDAFKSGQGVVIRVADKHSGPLQEAMTQFSGPGVQAGLLQLIEMLDQEETAVTGLNEEILGTDDKDIPGILHQYRTGAALTGMGGIFQNFRRAKWQLGIKMLKVNQLWLSEQDVVRATGQQVSPGFYDPDFVRFDCNPCEGLLTESQRQLYFLELKELYLMFPQLIPASFVISAAPVQQSHELIAAVRKAEQQQSQMAQAELRTKERMDAMILAQAELDSAKAVSEIADADYDRARTLSEIQKVGDDTRLGVYDRLLKYMEINQNMQLARIQAQNRTVKK